LVGDTCDSHNGFINAVFVVIVDDFDGRGFAIINEDAGVEYFDILVVATAVAIVDMEVVGEAIHLGTLSACPSRREGVFTFGDGTPSPTSPATPTTCAGETGPEQVPEEIDVSGEETSDDDSLST
jgi:hypothetical protein